MNNILQKIVDKVNSCEGKSDFVDVLFGEYKESALAGESIVLFGAGDLGVEMLYALQLQGVTPTCFCDNNTSKQGKCIKGIPVISFDELQSSHKDSLIVLTLCKNVRAVASQLKNAGFDLENIFRKEDSSDSSLLAMYAMVGTQVTFVDYNNSSKPQSILDNLISMETKIKVAHDAYMDDKSKELFIAKLALYASNLHFSLFKEFMLMFSEPVHQFGMLNYNGTPEDYYYFNNDVLEISEGEVYVDVGAFDGDTIESFNDACNKLNVNYKKIYGFEPDPECYKSLENNVASYDNVSLHKLGLWSESKTLEFTSSGESIHDQAGSVAGSGNVKIEAVSLDDFLDGDKVTFIKMDPSGDIVNEVLLGAEKTISKHKPKLALGIYHSLEEFIDIPIYLKEICPEYKLVLRHNTYHLCDTDLYAYV